MLYLSASHAIAHGILLVSSCWLCKIHPRASKQALHKSFAGDEEGKIDLSLTVSADLQAGSTVSPFR